MTLRPAASASAVITVRMSASWKSITTPSVVARAPGGGATGCCPRAAPAPASSAASRTVARTPRMRSTLGSCLWQMELHPGAVRRAEDRASRLDGHELERADALADAHGLRRLARELVDGEAAPPGKHDGAEQPHGRRRH